MFAPTGSEAAVIGPTELRRLERLGAPANVDDMAIRLDPGTEPPRVTVALPRGEPRDLPPDPATAPLANLHLQFASVGTLEKSISQKFQFGALLVVVGHLPPRPARRTSSGARESAP